MRTSSVAFLSDDWRCLERGSDLIVENKVALSVRLSFGWSPKCLLFLRFHPTSTRMYIRTVAAAGAHRSKSGFSKFQCWLEVSWPEGTDEFDEKVVHFWCRAR